MHLQTDMSNGSEAEEVAGEYVWGVYDLLLLPPSFPYGGMENPCLTFVTPTLLAGDRSLVNVVAHEIAHSWTGNLVTNATWEHFWLNEGVWHAVYYNSNAPTVLPMFLKYSMCHKLFPFFHLITSAVKHVASPSVPLLFVLNVYLQSLVCHLPLVFFLFPSLVLTCA